MISPNLPEYFSEAVAKNPGLQNSINEYFRNLEDEDAMEVINLLIAPAADEERMDKIEEDLEVLESLPEQDTTNNSSNV